MEDLLPPKVGTTSDFELKKGRSMYSIYKSDFIYFTILTLFLTANLQLREKKKVKIVSLNEACEKLFVHYS